MPMLMPAIFASAVLVFAGVIDDFVIVEQMSSNAGTTDVGADLLERARGWPAGTQRLATLMLVFSLIVAALGYVAYRFMTRGERGNRGEALTSIAGI